MPEDRLEKEKRRFLMKKCVALAQRAEGKVESDPLVGVLIYYKDVLISEAFAQHPGDDPLLRALEEVKDKSILKNAVVYTNIEPSCERAKNDGAHALMKYHVNTLVIGVPNPFLLPSKRSIKKLIKSGIQVHTKSLLKECTFINRRYFHFQEFKKPYIILNYFGGEKNSLNYEIFEDWRKEYYTKEAGFLLAPENILEKNDQFIFSTQEKRTPIRLIFDLQLSVPSYYYVASDDFRSIFFNKIENKEEEGKLYIKLDATKFEEQEEAIPILLKHAYRNNIISLIIENNFPFFKYFIDHGLWNEINFIQSKHDILTGFPIPLPERFFYKKWKDRETLIETYINKN